MLNIRAYTARSPRDDDSPENETGTRNSEAGLDVINYRELMRFTQDNVPACGRDPGDRLSWMQVKSLLPRTGSGFGGNNGQNNVCDEGSGELGVDAPPSSSFGVMPKTGKYSSISRSAVYASSRNGQEWAQLLRMSRSQRAVLLKQKTLKTGQLRPNDLPSDAQLRAVVSSVSGQNGHHQGVGSPHPGGPFLPEIYPM
jgi:hypothetical protein